MELTDLLIACITKLDGEDLERIGPHNFTFTLWSIPAIAYVQDGGRMRGSVIIDSNVSSKDMPHAIEWAGQQRPTAGRVDAAWVSESDDDGGCIRLLFERDLDPETISENDLLASEAYNLLVSWAGLEPDPDTNDLPGPLNASDPTRVPPMNAWLLIGAQDSYPDADELEANRHDAVVGIYETAWTAAKQTEPGDLLFFYFRAPHKAIHFVARAADRAFFEDIGSTGGEWGGRQWWTHITPLIEIKPITFDQLQEVTGAMVMKGRSGHYLRPEHAAELGVLARPKRAEDSQALASALRPVVGRADHPDPAALDLAQWRALASGTFSLEADVERLVVEPLIRMALADHPDAILSKAHRSGARIVDYVVLRDAIPACAIEVKLRVHRSRSAPWSQCADFQQAADYGRRLGVPTILIDAQEIHLIPRHATEPARTLSRSVFLDDDLTIVRRHILGR